MEDGLLALVAQSGAGHVNHAQRVQEVAGATPATVGDQVHLDEPAHDLRVQQLEADPEHEQPAQHCRLLPERAATTFEQV